jgi:redox-sensitive bicupin YhaK (pirin superfamily)
LPSSEKLCEPRYQDLQGEAIPQLTVGRSAKIRVIAGSCQGVTGAVRGISVDPLFLDVKLAPEVDQVVEIPNGHSACLYVLEGQVQVLGAGRRTQVNRGKLAVLSADGHLLFRSAGLGARLLVIAARPLKEPVARYGPFVMNTREQVQRAVEDLRSGRFLG